MRILSTCLLLLLIFGNNVYSLDKSSLTIGWGYKGMKGPSRWGELNSSFTLCSTGKMQSPINIPAKTLDAKSELKIHYMPAAFDIINDGTTDLTIGNQEIVFDDGRGIQVNFVGAEETIEYKNEHYQLIQFHIHTPSETTWQGQSFPLEIHFVHQGPTGKVVVLAVLAKGGKENTELQTIIDAIPLDKQKLHKVTGKGINPANLLPNLKSYYSFQGSLTTPPCTEGLQWVVLSNAITVSPAQIARLKTAVGGNNSRPVQPLNMRNVYYAS